MKLIRKENIKSCLIVALFIALINFVAQAQAMPQKTCLQELKQLQIENKQELVVVDQQINHLLKSSQKIELKNVPNKTHSKFESIEVAMDQLINKRAEHLLRQDFLDRLSFMVESHYQNGNLKDFLVNTFTQLAANETQSQTPNGSMWKFLNYLSLAVKELPERSENLIAFIDGYMNFSSINSPIRPDEYVSQRDYTNGTKSSKAHSKSLEDIGEIVDHKLKIIDQQRAALRSLTQDSLPTLAAPNKPFELSLKIKELTDTVEASQDINSDIDFKIQLRTKKK